MELELHGLLTDACSSTSRITTNIFLVFGHIEQTNFGEFLLPYISEYFVFLSAI
jgi:hypothetical protein